jgi:hypothetical protein
MLMGMFGQGVLGLCELARRTDSACCRTTVGGKPCCTFSRDVAYGRYYMNYFAVIGYFIAF